MFSNLVSRDETSKKKAIYSLSNDCYVENTPNVVDALYSNSKYFSKQCKTTHKLVESFMERLGRNSSLLPLNQLRDIMFCADDEMTDQNKHAANFCSLFASKDPETVLLLANVCTELFVGSSFHRFLDHWTIDREYTCPGSEVKHGSLRSACLRVLLDLDKSRMPIDRQIILMAGKMDKSWLANRIQSCLTVISKGVEKNGAAIVVALVEVAAAQINQK